MLASVRVAAEAGLRVSLDLLTQPDVTDEASEIEAAEAALSAVRVDMVQTRTLNIDPERYFAAVDGRSNPWACVMRSSDSSGSAYA